MTGKVINRNRVEIAPRVRAIPDRSDVFEVVGLPDASPTFRTREKAEMYLAEQAGALPARRQPQERPCLCCGGAFLSAGAHNRLCDDCRRQDGGPVPMGIVRPQRRGDGAVR